MSTATGILDLARNMGQIQIQYSASVDTAALQLDTTARVLLLAAAGQERVRNHAGQFPECGDGLPLTVSASSHRLL
jgi:hypothetical protein